MLSILRLITFCFVISVCFSSCHSGQSTAQSGTRRELIFGSGGGFSGQVIEYTLLENGKISSVNSLSKESKVLTSLPKKEVQRYFEQATQLNLEALDFKHPGNMSYFIRLKEGEKQQEIIWGDTDHPVPAQVQELYQALNKATSQ